MSIICPVCKSALRDIATDYDTDRTTKSYYNCQTCGKFFISLEAVVKLQTEVTPRHTLSSFLREYNEYSYIPSIENIIEIGIKDLDISPPDIDEKIEKFLRYVSKKQKSEGSLVEITTVKTAQINSFVLFYCKDADEFRLLVESLIYLQYCEFDDPQIISSTLKCKLTYLGIKKLYQINEINSISKQCFVAMSFSPEHKNIFIQGIKPAVESINNFKAYRVDEDRTNGEKIDNKIISEIKKSRFMVADFTGNKHNVYYEIGFAMGFKLPIIFTCEKTFFEGTDKVKFDLRQYPIIVFSNFEELKTELTETIKVRII
jgi:hypothetical protein